MRPLSVLLAVVLLVDAPAHGATPETASTADVAGQFLRVLIAEADLPRAYRDYALPDFIEHNPEIGNGYRSKIAYFAKRRAAHPHFPSPEKWANVVDHVIVDGDLFAVHRHVFTDPADGGRVFVDIWRVAAGKIVEHWDVIQPVPKSPANANTMWCGRGSDYRSARALKDTSEHPTCGAPDASADRIDSLAVIGSYGKELDSGDVAAAVQRFNAPSYVQHSPEIRDGIAALGAYLSAQLSGGENAKPAMVIARVLAQGNLVLVHRHVTRRSDPRGYVSVDIFRIRGARICEHWDVQQAVPATSENGNTMW